MTCCDDELSPPRHPFVERHSQISPYMRVSEEFDEVLRTRSLPRPRGVLHQQRQARRAGEDGPHLHLRVLTQDRGLCRPVILLTIAAEEKPLDAFHALLEPVLHLDDVVESLGQRLDAVVEDLELHVEVLRQWVLIALTHPLTTGRAQ